jgi:membrane protein DedA with SNARE-associated domain
MWEEILKTITLVYLPSMLKFIFGPLAGYAAGLTLLSTVLGTVAGTMTVVVLFAFFGDFIQRRILNAIFRNRKLFSERSRKFVNIWKRYGLTGVALLTPILLTPIGGTLLAISFGTPRNKLILYMFVSAAAWAFVLSVAIYFFGNEVIPEFIKPS